MNKIRDLYIAEKIFPHNFMWPTTRQLHVEDEDKDEKDVSTTNRYFQVVDHFDLFFVSDCIKWLRV